MKSATYNQNGKIWLFINDSVSVELLSDNSQQITMKLNLQDNDQSFFVIVVLAKCTTLDRLDLWDDIYGLASNMQLTWLLGGDFNVIMNEDIRRIACISCRI